MEIINLNRQTCQIKFEPYELLILENSLLKVYQHFTVYDFEAVVRGISKDESLKLAQIIGEAVKHNQQNESCLELEKKSTFSIQLNQDKDRVILQLTYKSLLGLRSILNQVCHGGVPIQDFQVEIGFKRATIDSFLESISSNIVKKMEEDSPEQILFKEVVKTSKIFDIESIRLIEDPKILPIKKVCHLILEECKFSLILGILKRKPPMYSIVQIIASTTLHPSNSPFFRSKVQAIRYYDLIHVVAYLKLALDSAFENTDLETFTLNLLNSGGEPLVDIQVLSQIIKSREEDSLKIRFRMYLDTEEENKEPDYLEIKGTATASNIQSFISSIRDFISELPRK